MTQSLAMVGWLTMAAWANPPASESSSAPAPSVEAEAAPEEASANVEARLRDLEAENQALRAQQAETEAQLREQIREEVRQELSQPGSEASEPVRVGPGAEVDEVSAFGADVIVEGRVVGDAVSFGGDVFVTPTGRVGGGAVSFGGQVHVEPGGEVEGDRVAMPVPEVALKFLPLDPHVADGALLVSNPSSLWASLQWRLVVLLAVAGAGMLVVGLFPSRVSRVARDLEVRPLRAAILGSLTSSFVILFSVLFAVLTLFLGTPVSLLLLGALGVAWLLGFVGLCQAVGDRLPLERRPHGRWLAFLVGVVLVALFSSLPWIGMLVVSAASVLAIGAAVSTRLGSVAISD